MSNAEANQENLESIENIEKLAQMAKVAPIVRGLLAEPTGDEDIKYCPPIIQCLTDAAGEEPAVFVDLADAGDDEAMRELLAKAVADKPEAIGFKGLGVMRVVEKIQWDPQRPLNGKVALVTGAAGAIGYGVCKSLLENGCYLAASDLAGAKLDEFVAEMEKLFPETPGRVIGVAIDVTDEESVEAGFARVATTWGGVDIVVHNAGIAHVSKLADMDLGAFVKLEKVNVEGTLLTIRQAGREMVTQQIGGDIVVMSTKNVPSPSAGFGAYSATKAASHQLGRIASLELAPNDIRVNMVAPDAVFAEGKFKSGLWQEVGKDRMKARGLDEQGLHDYYRQRNLLKAKVTGRHVANAVLFFVKRLTPTTGATIPVDGGLPDATPR